MSDSTSTAQPHPSIETWIDYHAGEVSEEERRRLQRHLSSCRRCVDLVLDLDAFAAPGIRPERAVGDFERAAAWRAVKGVVGRQPDARWTRRVAPWPAVAAVAASLLFAAVGLSQRSARVELEAQLAELTRLRPNMVIADLRPGARERSSGGVDATVDLPAEAGVTLVLHLEDEVDHPDYELRVADAAGAEIHRIGGLEISDVGNFRLGLPPGALAAGSYELRLFGLGQDGEHLLETYPIRQR